jgi:2-iminobutanoate/2-iminopropanoate deaminase
MPQSPDAPERMAGMVPGVRAGGFLFLSAIRGRVPGSGAMSEDPLEQARQALTNLEAVLRASGATLRHVVKVTLYLSDLEMRKPFHEAWMEFFPTDPPARIAICVADANAAPGGKAHFALDVIALAP